ncbi:MAG: SWIM zinc finger family protein, partial [Microcystis sp. LE19-196.1B]|nr:SWIM zinc finger family protein [Microcystis sp. LE19-196.1B]
MTIPPINEKIIRKNTTNASYQRGQYYYDKGAVISLWQRGQNLQALVSGSEVKPYRVAIDFNQENLENVSCSCPYDYEGWCKHIVAVLLTCSRQPKLIIKKASLEELLTTIDEGKLRKLLNHLVAKHPEIIETIDKFLVPATPVNKAAGKITINVKAYRNTVRNELRQSLRAIEEDYYEEDPISDEIYALVDEAQDYYQKGEPDNAIAILEAIISACIEEWDNLENYGAVNDDLSAGIDRVLTAAILSKEFNPQEKQDLREKIEQWQDEWSADFEMSLAALQQGWDDPILEKILRGESANFSEMWSGNIPNYSQTLTSIRLEIFEQQEKDQEYLNLALASGQVVEYLTKLVYLDRIEEAMASAKNMITKNDEAFFFAKALRDESAPESALIIARGGLNFPGNYYYQLALWTSELAQSLGDIDTALAARIKAFQDQPYFSHYQKIESLAGEDWPDLKLDLLDYLREFSGGRSTEAKIDIFLHENLVRDAIKVVSDNSYVQSHLIWRIMDA